MANVNRTDINTTAKFASILTDMSGSGVIARVTSPALVTPTIAGATLSGTLAGASMPTRSTISTSG